MKSVFLTSLILVVLCHSQIDTSLEEIESIDMDILFNHQTGSIITAEEDQNLRKIYDGLDTNKDGILLYDEFKSLNIEIYSIVFEQMDLNEDGQLKYNEMVYYYQEMIETHPQSIFDETHYPEWSSLETEFNQITDSAQYNNQSQAEFLANILLTEIDTDNNNFISSTQFNEYNIKQDWTDLVIADNNNERLEINFDEFKSNFFNSIEYEIQYNLDNETQQNLDELEIWYHDFEDDHVDADVILNEIDENLLWNEHQFDTVIETGDIDRRRLLFGIFNAINIIRKVTKITRAINTVISPPKLDKSCDDKTLIDWMSNQFKITSKEICTSILFNLCVDKSCGIDQDIFKQAIISSNWDWNNDNCNDKYFNAGSRSEDMKCSSGRNELYKFLSLGSIDLTFYNKLWDSLCKIHDMCYKTDGNKVENCDNEFRHNMETICDLKYPFSINIIEKNACLAVAYGYYQATVNFGDHKGGINPSNCVQ